METIKFNDFLNEQLSDNSFNEGYQAEKVILRAGQVFTSKTSYHAIAKK